MSRHDPMVDIRQMLSHANEAVDLTKNRCRSDLDTDRLLNLAVVRLLEVIGEAANRVPVNIQNRYSEIRWREVISLRNRLIHGYDAVDYDIVWEILKHDLPELMDQLNKILQSNDYERLK